MNRNFPKIQMPGGCWGMLKLPFDWYISFIDSYLFPIHVS